MIHDKLNPLMIRQFLNGLLDRSALPPLLVRQLEEIQRRYVRRVTRHRKREAKAEIYRAVALQGGGKREVARRLRQMAA